MDTVRLRVRGDRDLRPVVRMTVGGLATRLDLSYAEMDDLQLGVESILDAVPEGAVLDLTIVVEERSVGVTVEPLDRTLLNELLPDRADGSPGLRRLLETLVETVEDGETGSGAWVRVTRRISPRAS